MLSVMQCGAGESIVRVHGVVLVVVVVCCAELMVVVVVVVLLHWWWWCEIAKIVKMV